MPNGLVFKCHLNTGQPDHLNTGQMDGILISYVLVQYIFKWSIKVARNLNRGGEKNDLVQIASETNE